MIMKYICTFCFISFSGLLLDTYNCLIFCPLDYYLYVVSLLYFTFNYVSLDGKFIGFVFFLFVLFCFSRQGFSVVLEPVLALAL